MTAIGCYKCSSTNNDSSCIDPFNPGLSPHNFYEPDCKSGIPGRYGLFPARFCLKVSGYIGKLSSKMTFIFFYDAINQFYLINISNTYLAGTRDQIVIRTCTVSKLLDSDSSHSSFTLQLDENTNVQVLSGLIASCKDDGCNHAASLLKRSASKFTSLCIFAIFTFLINYFRW